MSDDTDEIDPIDDILKTVMTMTGWTELECRNFLSSIHATSPEQLMDDIPDVIELAIKVQWQAAMIDIIKQVGRIVETKLEDGDLSMRFNPSVKINMDHDMHSMEIDFSPIATKRGVA